MRHKLVDNLNIVHEMSAGRLNELIQDARVRKLERVMPPGMRPKNL